MRDHAQTYSRAGAYWAYSYSQGMWRGAASGPLPVIYTPIYVAFVVRAAR